MGLEFAAIDVETANSERGSVCSIGVSIVRDGRIRETVNLLTRPPQALDWFDGFNVALHGIRPKDVESMPRFAERLDQVLSMTDGLPLVAHSAHFDIGAIRKGCDASDLYWPELTYGCSLVMSRRALSLLSYRLPIVCAELGVELTHHHDAAADAAASAQIVIELARRSEVASLPELAAGLDVHLGRLGRNHWKGCVRNVTDWRSVAPNPDADPHHDLFGQTIVFTGALSIVRDDAWAAAASLGAIPERNVTRRTTILVVGDGFTGDSPEQFHTGKAARAAKLNAAGQEIEVLTEEDFLNYVYEPTTSGSKA